MLRFRPPKYPFPAKVGAPKEAGGGELVVIFPGSGAPMPEESEPVNPWELADAAVVLTYAETLQAAYPWFAVGPHPFITNTASQFRGGRGKGGTTVG